MKGKKNITPFEQSVIDFVVKLRNRKNLTQQDIATILHVERTFITSVESKNSRAKYNLNHLNMIADHFGMSPKDFLPEKPII